MVAKFKDQEELIALANDSMYGLAASVYSQDITKALTTANALHAGTVWINQHNILEKNVPFGGYKREHPSLPIDTSRLIMETELTTSSFAVDLSAESGMGRELGEAALENYTEVKSIHINLTGPPPF